MAEPYGTLGATVPESDDYASGGADVPKAFREFSDSLGEGQGAGKLLIVQNTGAAAWKAMSGDATIDKAGKLTIANGAVNSSKVEDGSLADSDLAKPTFVVAVQANGTLLYGSGVTTVKLSTGHYKITPDKAFSTVPIAIPGMASPGLARVWIDEMTKTGIEVRIQNSAEEYVDGYFNLLIKAS